MANELAARTLRFCKALGDDTGRQPMQWRSVLIIGARCGFRAPAELEKIVAHGVKAGWLEVEGKRGVCLTDAGRRL